MDSGTQILVIGKAKTGTTFLSKAIQNSLPGCDYLLEPKGLEPELFSARHKNLVVKIIYEHFDRRPNLRKALILNELPLQYKKRVLIVRDPRDELISRLLYIVKPLKDQGRINQQNLEAWLTLLRRKENDPESVSFLQLAEGCDKIFGTKTLESFCYFLDPFLAFYQSRPREIYTISYEAVVDKRIQKLEEYFGFALDFKLKDEPVLRQTRRSGEYGSWRHFFHPSDLKVLRPMLDQYTSGLGYGGWELNPNPVIQQSDVSGYVSRLASETFD